MTKPTMRVIGDGAILQWGETVRMEARRIPAEEEGGEPTTEWGVYQWRAPTKAEQKVHLWADDHLIWGLTASYEDRDVALAAAAALAGE